MLLSARRPRKTGQIGFSILQKKAQPIFKKKLAGCLGMAKKARK
jgi:hypothetical protein